MWWKISLIVIVVALALVIGGGYWLGSKSAAMPAPQRARPIILPPCPDSPNCVSSKSSPDDSGHYLPPLELPANPLARLKQSLEQAGCRIVKSEPGYLQASCASAWFGFVDNVEFTWAESPGRLDFRSASRVGYSDFGANAKRIKALIADLK